jgi:two-component system response regulator AtoC
MVIARLRTCWALSANGVQDRRETGLKPGEFPTTPELLPIDDSASELRKRNLVNKPVDISNDFPMDYQTTFAPMIGHSPRMRAVRQSIEQVADTDATVLILGESGVGKEVVAKALHAASPRATGPFVKVNCAALPSELLESELFGHEKGAFTGAYRRKIGKFELAHGGTICLDEIGDMPIALQAKLLQILQDHEFTRVGGSSVLRVDVRVIAATNRNLESAVRSGQFREDLYYRLKVVTIQVPPLRERKEEIPILARTFVRRFNEENQRQVTLSPESLRLLGEYSWPGNIRELENMMKRVVVLESEELLREELHGLMNDPEPEAEPLPAPRPVPVATDAGAPVTLRELARKAALDAQRMAIRDVLERVHWNRAEAARVLHISYKALLYKMDQCGLGRKRPRRVIDHMGGLEGPPSPPDTLGSAPAKPGRSSISAA